MAGETLRTEAICLDIRPWSRTSHVVSWLMPTGKLSTVVKGAVRPKSLFLGQYDLNYTCDILYYARTKGEVHALRECVPVVLREFLRRDYRALALAGYFRRLVLELAPQGEECRVWYKLLSSSLDSIVPTVDSLIRFELEVLRLSGLAPDFSKYDENAEWSSFSIEKGTFSADEGRCIRISRRVADYLCGAAENEKNSQTPLDAARVIGVFYQFHLDCSSDVRRSVLGMISEKQGRQQ